MSEMNFKVEPTRGTIDWRKVALRLKTEATIARDEHWKQNGIYAPLAGTSAELLSILAAAIEDGLS